MSLLHYIWVDKDEAPMAVEAGREMLAEAHAWVWLALQIEEGRGG